MIPRHRKPPPPRTRALGWVDVAARRARLSAALAAGDTAITETDPAPDLSEPRPSAPPVSGTLMRSAARGLLVTPWFAASAGFVIAAALWSRSPHTVLRFPNSTPAIQPCAASGCGAAGGGGGGQLDVSAPGQRLREPARPGRKTGPSPKSGRGAREDVTFTYLLLGHLHGTFSAVITLSGRKLPADWALTFELPGARITRVLGAKWQQWASDDGGQASPIWSWTAGSGRPSDQVVSFVVTGSGQAPSPQGCFFDGASCSFTEAQGGGWQGVGDGHDHGAFHGDFHRRDGYGNGGQQGQGGGN